jgi:SOS response regulatory protein OraA/RecX
MPSSRPPLDAFAAAVRLLAARDRTQAELDAALETRGYPAAARRAAIAEAVRLHYLDDVRAGGLLARRWLGEGRSVSAVAARLEQKGLATSLAGDLARDQAVALGHSDEAAARRLVAARRTTGVRAARLLASRGFSEELIARVLGLDDA